MNMKNLLLSVTILIILSACAAGKPFGSTFTPSFTATLAASPTPSASSTPEVPSFYHGLAPTLEQFTELGSKADISRIVAYLRSQPSLLTDGDNPEPVQPTVGSFSNVYVHCNSSEKINCAIAASFKIKDQGQWQYFFIVEMRNKDGSRGYLTGFGYDQDFLKLFPNLVERKLKNLTIPKYVILVRNLSNDDKVRMPYWEYLILQPGYQDQVEQFLQTTIIPPALEDMIVIMFVE